MGERNDSVLRRLGKKYVGVTSLAFIGVMCGVVAIACTTDYQKGLDDVHYGGPNALVGAHENATADTAGTSSTGSSGGGADTPACVKGGGALAASDAGTPCAVSWNTDIVAAFGNAGCATPSCHGGTAPQYQPRIEPGDSKLTYTNLANWTLSAGGGFYVNPCSIDPTQSKIACNLAATTPCGSHMPEGGGQIDSAVLQKLDAWIKCGSPNN